MMNLRKMPAALVSVGLIAIAFPGVTCASELDELKAQLQALQARVTKMEEDQKQAATVTAIAPAGGATGNAKIGTAGTGGLLLGTSQTPLSINVAGGTVTLYGNVDEYMNRMKSSSGAKLTAMQDGAVMRSRFGFKGDRDLGSGYGFKFQLEQGFNLTNGSAADTPDVVSSSSDATPDAIKTTGRMFDRQAWAGVATPFGEFRAGRQNTAIFTRGDYIDFGSRTLGSVINNFGVPSRYDGDISYISPRIAGLLAEFHYAIAGANPVAGTSSAPSTVSVTNMGVYQFALDYLNGPFRAGYAGIEGRPDTKGSIAKNAEYHNYYANYDYGKGKIYGAYVRSNNGGGALSNVGGYIVSNNPSTPTGSNTGSLNSGLDSSLNTYYDIYQLSVDYKITDQWRVGGLWGRIKDTSNQSKGATGWALGTYYDVNTNLLLYALLDSIDNEKNGNFGPAGSAGLTKTFSGTDKTGQRIDGLQTGFLFKF